MDSFLLDLLADPVGGGALTWTRDALCGASGRCYPVVDGIPRFVTTTDAGQKQTEASFGYKWKKRDTYDSPASLDTMRAWQIERYGFDGAAGMRDYFTSRRLILDAGCGSGFSASVWLADCRGPVPWVGADISEAIDVARQRLGHVPGTRFVQADVLQMPFRAGTFDTIFSEGVLHHTPSTEAALKALAPLLAAGGEFLFYVYRKKGPIREFADDHIRDLVSGLPADEAWERLRPLTQLGQALAELKAEIDVPADVPYLGIKAGKQDVQRLIYWNFLKLFWNEQLSFEENLHVNFDWYHPRYAHRQTEDEVRRWCAEAGLTIHRLHTQESGFTVRATRN